MLSSCRIAVLRRTLFTVVLALLAVSLSPVNAQSEPAAAMSQAVYDGLQTAQTLVEGKQYQQGIAELKKLQDIGELSSYETAQIWNLTGYAYYLQERYQESARAYTRVLKEDGLPDALIQSTLKTLSQLYFTLEDYRRALKAVERLLSVVAQPSADILLLKGQAHFQLQEYGQALGPINAAINKYRKGGKPPQENWLLLLRVCYYELGDFKNMVKVLRVLIREFPKDRYIHTLASVYSELGETQKQLALTEALYEDGKLTKPFQLINLANLYLVERLPYKAAKMISTELEAGRLESSEKTLRLLSQAWYQAREDDKAIPPLAQAAEKSSNGELHIRLAQSYVNLDQWADAANAIRQGLAKGGVNRPDTAQLMLGMALFNQQQFGDAKRAFQNARSDERSAKAANQWLRYIASEESRDETLEQTIPEQQALEQDAILENL